MLVSCCSVLFSTFATAYTTNDGTTPNYGVYTYDFLTKDADGNVVDAYPSKAHDVLSNSNSEKGYSYITTLGEGKGIHLAITANKGTTVSNWAQRAFVRDPDVALSLTNSRTTGCYFALENGTTYTMVLKYKLESLDSTNVGTNSSGAAIGIGFWDPQSSTVKQSSLYAQGGCSGETKTIIESAYFNAVQTEWQYLTVTVKPEDLTFTKNEGLAAGDGSITKKYIQIYASNKTANVYPMFHIESLTVVAIDNEYVDTYKVYDETTTDGSLTENVKIATTTYKYDFIKEDGTSAYGTEGAVNHNLLPCGSLTGAGMNIVNKRADYKGVSYVDETGMHIAGYASTSLKTQNWSTRAFVLDDLAISKPSDATNGANYLYLKDNTTYTFILKYKLESLDAAYEIGNVDGTRATASDAATGAYIGIGFLDPDQQITERTVSNTNGSSGKTTMFAGGESPLATAKHTEWQYLTVTVDSNDVNFSKEYTDRLSTKYVNIFVRPSSGEKLVMFHVESLTVIALNNDIVDEYGIEADGTLNYENVTVYNKAEKAAQKINEYNFAFGPFAKYWTTLKYNNPTAADDYTKVDYTTGADALSGYESIVANDDGSITVQPKGSSQRIAFYTGSSFLYKKNYYNNAVFAKANAKYYMEVVFSSDATASTDNSTISICTTTSMIESSNGKFGWGGASPDVFGKLSNIGYSIKPGEKYDHAKVNLVIDMADRSADVGKGLAIYLAGVSATTSPAVTIHSAKIVEVLPEASAIVEYDENDYDFEVIDASAFKGMTLPRPKTTEEGKIGAGWVDNTGKPVSVLPDTDFLQVLYPVYKKEVFDFDKGQGYYDPADKFGKGAYLNTLFPEKYDPVNKENSTNTAIRWDEMFWGKPNPNSPLQWLNSNLSYLSFTLFGDEKVPFELKPNTTYKLSLDYLVYDLGEKAALGMHIRYVSAGQIGNGEGTSIITPTISTVVSEGNDWDKYTIEFTTPDDISDQPYLSLLFHNSGKRFSASDENKFDESYDQVANWGRAYIDNIVVEEISTVGLDANVEKSFSSIRPEDATDAENPVTSALRVSAAISKDVANAAQEIGFIALPTAKATANWYKFDENGKLADKVVSVKVKDTANGLLNTTGEQLKDSEGNVITELTAPKDVPAITGYTSYQLIITGLQKVGVKKAGLRNDAISVVLYTKDNEGNYTYYFANEVSYDMVVTKMALAGDEYDDCLYVVE